MQSEANLPNLATFFWWKRQKRESCKKLRGSNEMVSYIYSASKISVVLKANGKYPYRVLKN
jgi:hypothetical protein